MRKSGVLLHPSCFDGKYPIGDLGYKAYDFIDVISECGFGLWQVLPLNPVGWGGSPYMSPSSMSFDTNLISPELLKNDGFIDEIEEYLDDSERIDFEKATEYKNKLIKKSYDFVFNNNVTSIKNQFEIFKKEFSYFNDVALFFALADDYGFEWAKWPKTLNIKKLKKDKKEYIDLYVYGQFIFYVQWSKLKDYAHEKNIKIVGDIPIYVSYNSSDVWLNKEVFDLNKKTNQPNMVAGVPPDYFSETGQLWGNPLYKWFEKDSTTLNKKCINWWIDRFNLMNKVYDVIRIDHFRAFESYWAVKNGEETAINGNWLKGPSKIFFEKIFKKIPDLDLIAEDLGILTPEVEKLRDSLGIPGMKVLQFAMSGPDNKYLPTNFESSNCIVYTGTHDNDTTKGWFENEATENEKHFIWLYSKREYNAENISKLFIELAFSSSAKWAIIPFQDMLNLGAEARMNTPSLSSKENWSWRMGKDEIGNIDKSYFNEINWVYYR